MKRVHFLGIGGSGASAAAAIAEANGFEVTGCDKDIDNEFTTSFDKKQLYLGHNPNHLVSHQPTHSNVILEEAKRPIGSSNSSKNPTSEDSLASLQNDNYIDILAVTPAIYSLDPDNHELLKAKELGIEILTWQEFLGKYIAKGKFVIAVCGTHGKSTTTAMIAKVLEEAGLDPTVELGAIVPTWKTNFRVSRHPVPDTGSMEFLIVEADEFNDNFLAFTPDIAVVTNIEMDHPEYFADFDAVKTSFKKFLSSAKIIVANVSDSGVKDLFFEQSEKFSLRSNNNVEVIDYSSKLIDFSLQIPGDFNILNASAAYQVGLNLKVEPEVIKKSLENYTGLGRRFEHLGDFNGAPVYSDFAHHPTEIAKTLQAAREKFPDKKIWVIFQPHMFSRTKALFNDFVKVFKSAPADGIAIMDIYPSREIDTGLVTSKELVEAINQKNVEYSTWEEMKKNINEYIGENDVLFFMGAGDTDKWARQLLS